MAKKRTDYTSSVIVTGDLGLLGKDGVKKEVSKTYFKGRSSKGTVVRQLSFAGCPIVVGHSSIAGQRERTYTMVRYIHTCR